MTGALTEDVTTVNCTLSGGTETTCYRIVIAGVPADAAVGPFCPETIASTADESGIWLDGNRETYDADGAFIVDLPILYDDENWQLYDEVTGEEALMTAATEAGGRDMDVGQAAAALGVTVDALSEALPARH